MSKITILSEIKRDKPFLEKAPRIKIISKLEMR